MAEEKTYVLERWHGPAAPGKAPPPNDRHIAVLARQEDFDCVLLASRGLKLKVIARLTGLSIHQVGSRLKAAGLSVSELREARGPYAQVLIGTFNRNSTSEVTRVIRGHLERKALAEKHEE